MANADASRLTECARRHGMRNLREDGWMKVGRGLTTAAEVTRVTQEF
jgi:type II secretory ATPase GspE/PulE/Tfp pilus assembly ATPase PilB-like protein